MGARTTLQRWFFDPVVNVDGQHRGLGTIFTHDHFGPSTHQQVGLYATVLVEPPGSTWIHNETGVALYTRPDGGPTSWQAAILDGANSYREFYFEYTDFQHAYKPGVYVGRGQWGGPGAAPDANSFRSAINPSGEGHGGVPFPDLLTFPSICPGGVPTPLPGGHLGRRSWFPRGELPQRAGRLPRLRPDPERTGRQAGCPGRGLPRRPGLRAAEPHRPQDGRPERPAQGRSRQRHQRHPVPAAAQRGRRHRR